MGVWRVNIRDITRYVGQSSLDLMGNSEIEDSYQLCLFQDIYTKDMGGTLLSLG